MRAEPEESRGAPPPPQDPSPLRGTLANAGLEEAQAGIKIAGRNSNNLRYADDTTLMAESEEELKSLLIKVKDWRITGTGEPGGLPSLGLHRVGHD